MVVNLILVSMTSVIYAKGGGQHVMVRWADWALGFSVQVYKLVGVLVDEDQILAKSSILKSWKFKVLQALFIAQ